MAAFRTETGELSMFYWLARAMPHNATMAELFGLANSISRTLEQSANKVPLVRRERELIKTLTGQDCEQEVSI